MVRASQAAAIRAAAERFRARWAAEGRDTGLIAEWSEGNMNETLRTEADRVALTAPRTVKFWAQEYTVTPVLVAEVFGDGKQIIALQPLNTRPEYYVVRVDSGWCRSNWCGDAPLLDRLDNVYDAIEEEYGDAEQCHDGEGGCPADCRGQGEHLERDDWQRKPWPALDLACGCGWWLIERLGGGAPCSVCGDQDAALCFGFPNGWPVERMPGED